MLLLLLLLQLLCPCCWCAAAQLPPCPPPCASTPLPCDTDLLINGTGLVWAEVAPSKGQKRGREGDAGHARWNRQEEASQAVAAAAPGL